MTCDFNARWYICYAKYALSRCFYDEDDFINRWDCCGEGGLAF